MCCCVIETSKHPTVTSQPAFVLGSCGESTVPCARSGEGAQEGTGTWASLHLLINLVLKRSNSSPESLWQNRELSAGKSRLDCAHCHLCTLPPVHTAACADCYQFTLPPVHTTSCAHCCLCTLLPVHTATSSHCQQFTLPPVHTATCAHCLLCTLLPVHTSSCAHCCLCTLGA